MFKIAQNLMLTLIIVLGKVRWVKPLKHLA